MRRRGQSTLELALILPFVVGLLLLVLQVGLLVSDQVKLDHFAYEGAQWAIANPGTATADVNGVAGTGTISQHILGLMCGGGGLTPPSSAGSRFCTSQPSGVPALKVKVESHGTPTSLLPPAVAPTGQVMGSATCKLYSLSVSPVSAVINQTTSPTSVTFTITDTSMGGVGPNPHVQLNATGYPGWVQVPPVFSPSKITAGQSATVTVQAGGSTPAGTYSLSFNGTDDCTGLTASTGPARATLTVLGGASPSPTATPAATVGITGILPGLICLNVSSPITLNGFGFQSGATVTTGTISALSVTVVSSTQININTATLLAGVYNLVVTNPDNSTATLNSGLSVSASCAGGATPTPTTSGCCFNGLVGTPGTTTLTDLTSSWTTNQWVGATVSMGGSTATVISNNGTTLTFSAWTGGTPLPGPYTITLAAGSSAATNACASNSAQYQTIVTITWYEPLVIPIFAPSGSATPYFTLQSVRYAFCQ
ncbi:MAG TPA: TadE/TadG family type IV pilus assembly protein [Candidatus Solibacter sp.]|jgi:hypothetical protein|nr:TadE/TadG family type IV pilus assembly protein [Candidatus Solibacter sp.]